jgi:hypothetical protein
MYLESLTICKKFISLLPISNKHSSNLFGIRPIEHSRKQLLYFVSMFNDRNIIKDLIVAGKESMKKKSQIDLDLRYTSELYYMIYIKRLFVSLCLTPHRQLSVIRHTLQVSTNH